MLCSREDVDIAAGAVTAIYFKAARKGGWDHYAGKPLRWAYGSKEKRARDLARVVESVKGNRPGARWVWVSGSGGGFVVLGETNSVGVAA